MYIVHLALYIHDLFILKLPALPWEMNFNSHFHSIPMKYFLDNSWNPIKFSSQCNPVNYGTELAEFAYCHQICNLHIPNLRDGTIPSRPVN